MKETTKLNGQLKLYLAWPLLLAIFPAFGNVGVAMVSRIGGAILLPFTLCYILVAVWIYMYRRKRLLGGLVEFSASYAWVQKQLLTEMAVPYALADADGRILWFNDAFKEIFADRKGIKKSLLSLFPKVDKAILSSEEASSVHSTYGDRKFRVDVCPVNVDNACNTEDESTILTGVEKLLAIYLFDETEILEYRQEVTDEKLVCGLIYLDNYDEALESVEEVRRSLLTALIDRKINK